MVAQSWRERKRDRSARRHAQMCFLPRAHRETNLLAERGTGSSVGRVTARAKALCDSVDEGFRVAQAGCVGRVAASRLGRAADALSDAGDMKRLQSQHKFHSWQRCYAELTPTREGSSGGPAGWQQRRRWREQRGRRRRIACWLGGIEVASVGGAAVANAHRPRQFRCTQPAIAAQLSRAKRRPRPRHGSLRASARAAAEGGASPG